MGDRSPESQAAFVALLLRNGAGGLAGYTAAAMEEAAGAGGKFSGPSLTHWRDHTQQRIQELAAAVETGEPKLFVARIHWDRHAFVARELDEKQIAQWLHSLEAVLRTDLPAVARPVLEPFLSAAREAVAQEIDTASPGLDATDPHEKLALEYLATVLEGDTRGGIDRLFAALDRGSSVRDLYLKVLAPAQREVGRMWHDGAIGVWEEHLVSATTRRAMAQLLRHGTVDALEKTRTVVAMGVRGNLHDIGLQIVSDFFELAGWKVVQLGGDCPPADAAAAALQFSADVALVSATLTNHLTAARETIATIRAAVGPDIRILVGGPVLADVPDLWIRLGADGGASSAEEAIEEAERLIAGRE